MNQLASFLGLSLKFGFYAIMLDITIGYWQNAVIFKDGDADALGILITCRTDNSSFVTLLNLNIMAWYLDISPNSLSLGPLLFVKQFIKESK